MENNKIIYQGYSTLEISKSQKSELYNLVKSIIPNDFLYQDEKYGIEGNVCNSAHLTLHYGFKPEVDKNLFQKEFEAIQKIDDLIPDKVEYFIGYKNVYFILYLSVRLTDNLAFLNKTCKNLPSFDDIKPFIPHITLAYIKNINTERLHQIIEEMNQEISKESIKIQSLNFCRYGEQEESIVKEL